MFKKKVLSFALAAVIAAGIFSGCANHNNQASQEAESSASAEVSNKSDSSESAVSNASAETSAADSTSASDTANAITVKGITERSDEMRDISAKELVAEMTAGWNLGNTLEATGGEGLSSETSWGNPKITKELIDTVCEKGFDSIRIPITWGNHVA